MLAKPSPRKELPADIRVTMVRDAMFFLLERFVIVKEVRMSITK